MKKILSLLILSALVLGMFGCNSSQGETPAEEATGLQVGYCSENVTPDFSVGLGGFSDSESRKSTGVLDPVYITCIAATEGDQTVLMFTLDTLQAGAGVVEMIQNMASKTTGVPKENIIVSATHTHSAPALNSGESDAEQYKSLLYGAAGTAAQKAMEDRSPATIYTGTIEIDGMNFDRHYIMSDGKYEEQTIDTVYASHCTESDKRMVLLQFQRAAEDKKDILMVNWQAHPDHASQNGYTMISSDYPGALRHTVQEETGMLCAFFAGASGNQNPSSKVQSEKHGLKMQQYGQKLAEYAIEALPDLKQDTGTGIAVTKTTVEAFVDHSDDDKIAQANEVYNLWKSEGKAAGDALAETYGIYGCYHARAIRQRKDLPESYTLDLYAWRIGNIGFASGSYEMFSDAGMYIRENAPFETVLICNGNSGYIASEWAFEYHTYESNTGMYAKGTAENLADELVKLLDTVKPAEA